MESETNIKSKTDTRALTRARTHARTYEYFSISLRTQVFLLCFSLLLLLLFVLLMVENSFKVVQVMVENVNDHVAVARWLDIHFQFLVIEKYQKKKNDKWAVERKKNTRNDTGKTRDRSIFVSLAYIRKFEVICPSDEWTVQWKTLFRIYVDII